MIGSDDDYDDGFCQQTSFIGVYFIIIHSDSFHLKADPKVSLFAA